MIEQASTSAAKVSTLPAGSAVVAQLRVLSPRIRQTLRISDVGMQLLDCLMIVLRIIEAPWV